MTEHFKPEKFKPAKFEPEKFNFVDLDELKQRVQSLKKFKENFSKAREMEEKTIDEIKKKISAMGLISNGGKYGIVEKEISRLKLKYAKMLKQAKMRKYGKILAGVEIGTGLAVGGYMGYRAYKRKKERKRKEKKESYISKEFIKHLKTKNILDNNV